MNDKQQKILIDMNGKTTVLSIGINKYLCSELNNLQRPENDAKKVYDIFYNLKNLNLNMKTSLLFTSQNDMESTSKLNILRSIEKICENISLTENLVIYFSGHGHKIGNKNFLVPSDCDRLIESNLISIDEVLYKVSGSKAKSKLIIFDSCFSGIINKHGKGLSDFNFKSLKKYFINGQSFAFISSSSKDEVSFENSPNSSYSLLTTFLIEALEGKEEALDNNLLTVNSLARYLSENVFEYCNRTQGINQRPNFLNASNGETIIGVYNVIKMDETYDLDNSVEVIVEVDDDVFNYIESKLDYRISDSKWIDLKLATNELILNGFLHGDSNDISIEIENNRFTVIIDGKEFDSVSECRKENCSGLKIVKEFISKYINQIHVSYSYSDGLNKITFDFKDKVAFMIKDLCKVKVSHKGYRKITTEDIYLPKGKCKKYYYYIDKRNVCMSITMSAVRAISMMIPKSSTLIVVDSNAKKGSIFLGDYLLDSNIIYREM